MSDLRLWFDHGLGDCVHFAVLLQLYKQRGWNVSVHYEQNKSAVWRAAGLAYAGLHDNVKYHKWAYRTDFNRPRPEWDGSGNKIAANLNTPPLPPLGDPVELWEELCGTEVSGEELETPELAAQAENFLKGLPRPIVLLHTHGTNWSGGKSLPAGTVRSLYRILLNRMGGSLILLDWDHRVPKLPHARVRHLKDDWGHISLDQLYCLMRRAQLMIGVDSGPWHFSKFTRTPGLGVFHHHYPSCICLPRPEAVHMTRSNPDYRRVNIARRRRWNIVEYAGEMSRPEEIANQALRMLAGPRYLRDVRRIGRDVQIQQWIRDWCRGSTGTSWMADRNRTFDFLLREATRRFPAPQIVETGTIRAAEDWSAGYSTYIFGAYLDGLGAGRLVSVDNDKGHCNFSRRTVAPWRRWVAVEQSDSAQWLRKHRDPIDVLYLDSMDADLPGHAEYALTETKAAEPRLHDDSLVIFDDTTWNKGWVGKGALAIPYLLTRGWKIVESGYQVVLSKR